RRRRGGPGRVIPGAGAGPGGGRAPPDRPGDLPALESLWLLPEPGGAGRPSVRRPRRPGVGVRGSPSDRGPSERGGTLRQPGPPRGGRPVARGIRPGPGAVGRRGGGTLPLGDRRPAASRRGAALPLTASASIRPRAPAV